MEKGDKGSTMIRTGVSGWMFLLVPAYPGCPGSKAVKRSLLLSGTTWVGQYQKKHSPSHTHPDHRTSFIIFLHLQRCMASSLFILRAWQSSRTTSLQVLFGLVWSTASSLFSLREKIIMNLSCIQWPSVLWSCCLGSRKGILPVKNWVVGCWHGYLSIGPG